MNTNEPRRIERNFWCALAGLILAGFFAGCSDGKEAMPNPENEEDMKSILTPGSSQKKVAATFGKPAFTHSNSGVEVWLYEIPPFPVDDRPGVFVGGFTVSYTNGQLMYWGYSYVTRQGETGHTEMVKPAAIESSGDTPGLRFYVVHENSVSGGRFIDTASLPKLGFVAANPDLIIGRLEQVTLEERLLVGSGNQKQTNWCFKFTLPAEFIPALTAMTATNVSKRILMTANEEPVFAPTVQSPIKTANFEVTVSDRSSMEQLKQNLTRIPQAAP